MADYAFRSFSERQNIQSMWESGMSAQSIASALDKAPATIYTELRRGRDGTRLSDQRLRYDAALAQLCVQQGLERRGRKAARA